MSIKYNGGYIPAVGADGTTLVANSASATGVAWAGPSVAAGKNAIINGGMDIWQRGTSFAIAASSGITYTADRFCTLTGANQAVTISRQATGDTTNLPNIQYALRYQRNSGQTGTGALSFIQNIETINTIPFVGKQVTVSFYARAGANFSATSSILSFSLLTGAGTDQNAFSGFTSQATAIGVSDSLTTTWQRFTHSVTLTTSITQLALDFAFAPTGTAGANDYFEITGVQLELGSTATTFSRAGGSIGGELALCQRYFVTLGAGDFYGQYYNASSQFFLSGRFPVTMRTTPTSTLPSGTVTNAVQQVGVANYNASGFAYFAGGANSFSFTGTATGGTIYSPVAWLASNTTSFSAEL